MITISACLIVKNEEMVLQRCLDTIRPFADEIIIVDTGSSDRTKEIAQKYTSKIYDFCWVDDFSKARNYAFSLATKDYIYSADADEVLDEVNQERMLKLKIAMLPEIEIVQMWYTNQLSYNTTYNYDKEYRPKLFKRVRNFIWEDPIHEAVRLTPVIFDSDIEIIHLPQSLHAKRDFSWYKRQVERGTPLSKNLQMMYARELYICGEEQDFLVAAEYYKRLMIENILKEDELKRAQCIVARAARISNDKDTFFSICLKNVATKQPSAEICYELGEYYLQADKTSEAMIWFYNAAFETEAELNIHYAGDYPREKLGICYEKENNFEQAENYKELAKAWQTEYLKENNANG